VGPALPGCRHLSGGVWSLDIHGLEMILKRSGKRQRPNPDCANFVKGRDSKPSSRLGHSIHNRSRPAKSLHSRDTRASMLGPVPPARDLGQLAAQSSRGIGFKIGKHPLWQCSGVVVPLTFHALLTAGSQANGPSISACPIVAPVARPHKPRQRHKHRRAYPPAQGRSRTQIPAQTRCRCPSR